MLVDDEPSSVRYLKTIIEQKTNDFIVSSLAENGYDALQKIEKEKPDIVITDIKMPIMDGIELCSNIRKKYPYIHTILVSGYQEFEYARSAIKEGAYDYILKPININVFIETLLDLKEKIEVERYKKQIELLISIINNEKVNIYEVEKCFPFKRYGIAILRKGGIPLHFSTRIYLHKTNSFNDNKDIFDNQKIWTLYGRDQNEHIFIFSPEELEFKIFENYIKTFGESIKRFSYYTVLFDAKYFSLENLSERLINLIKLLNNSVIIGYSQVIYIDDYYLSRKERITQIDQTVEKKLNFYISNFLCDRVKEEIEHCLTIWEQERQPLIWVGNLLNQIINLIKNHIQSIDIAEMAIEYMLDEALCLSKDYNDLKNSIWDIVNILFKNIECNMRKNSSSLFNQIISYLNNNLSKPLSVQNVCQLFKISPTYLNTLFNKYKGISFNKYLINMRIEKAKDIICENPDIPIKEICDMVGFNDQFYFSRVFKALTGHTPSEFKEKNK